MTRPVVHADFNDFAEDGCLRFSNGTWRDLQRLGLAPDEGLTLWFSDGDLMALGRITACDENGTRHVRVVGRLIYLDEEPAPHDG
ncbi:hypothetical protein [Lysobacter enzymogenes]|uniref:hypothetical protein n=1 Tax=Lysobacter enzymogenes TaxID=69 RepID=UPI00099D56A2|nr:hypothetical protein [Lysobacter enzymogenes]UZW63097.1 hypothetical protein BV903_012775 [Lysobacter enzymogenes]